MVAEIIEGIDGFIGLVDVSLFLVQPVIEEIVINEVFAIDV